jgi:ribosomal protein L28
MSYITTEKGLERALEQTTRFYTDLEHIAIDLGTLTKRYSQSQQSLSKRYHRPIDALDWDWHDDMHSPTIQSPKPSQRKQQQLNSSLSSNRSNNKNKIRRRLNTNIHQTEYNESDNDNRSFDCTSSPLRRSKEKHFFFKLKLLIYYLGHSSVYFGSTDNTSDEENLGDETLQMTS